MRMTDGVCFDCKSAFCSSKYSCGLCHHFFCSECTKLTEHLKTGGLAERVCIVCYVTLAVQQKDIPLLSKLPTAFFKKYSSSCQIDLACFLDKTELATWCSRGLGK
eukprot:TRINITY_DN3083_c0_g1_i7.p1 TRINITY_DN3083_c0_g1~~TRINITY_DN3083_c0_g1_i7.p1  ORF type:complete len:106 (+),score=14.07 TRINITY_DN3083_c0_g1_i7:158-475(+)